MGKFNKIISVFVAAILMTVSVPLGSVALDAEYDSPISKLEIEDVTVIKNTHGYFENGNYIYCWVQPSFKVVLKESGEEISSTLGSVKIGEGYYSLGYDTSDQRNESWDIGTYQMTGMLFGLKDTFNVTVVESPVESIVASDISIIENTCGRETKAGYYEYNNTAPNVMVKYKDSDEMIPYGRETEYCGKTYYLTSQFPDQSVNHWKAGETYKASVSFMGVSDNFNVIIKPSPIERIEISDITVIENTNGSYDENGNFVYYQFSPKFTVYLKDNSKLNSDYGSVIIDGNRYYLQMEQIGEPLVAGNTYKIGASLMGFKSSFNLIVKETPIESIEINDVTVLENTHGYYKDGKYIYSGFNLKGKVKLKNSGDIIDISYGSISIGDEHHSITIDTDSQLRNPWAGGNTYEATAYLLGKKFNFNVTVSKLNVESVKFDDLTVIENTNGNFFGGYYHYDNLATSFTAVINGKEYRSENDITILNGPTGVYFGDNWLQSSFDPNSQTDPWEAGDTYRAAAFFAGIKGEFNVTIVKNPIADVKIKDCTVIKNLDYNVNTTAMVTYSDGTVIEKPLTRLNIDSYYDGFTKYETKTSRFGSYVDSSLDSGEYLFSITVNGKTYPFKVNVIDPISNIELVKSPDKTTLNECEEPDLFGAVFRVTYNGGDYEDIRIDQHSSGSSNDFVCLNKLGYSIGIYTYFDDDGFKAHFGRMAVDIPIIVENGIKSIELESQNGKTLTLKVRNNDGTQYDANIIGIDDFGFDFTETEKITFCNIMTDKASFNGKIGCSLDGKYVYVELEYEDNSYKSNALYGFDFLNSIYNLSECYSQLKFFNGKVTADNIDELVNCAIGTEMRDGYIAKFSGDEVRQAVKAKFAIGDIDLNLSKMFDSKTDTYTFDNRYANYVGNYLSELSYSDGIYNLVYLVSTGKSVRKKFVNISEDFRVLSIDTDYSLGDVNRDDSIDILDLIMLKKCIAKGDTEGIMSVADFNGDGSVNAADLTKLKKMLIS